MTQKAADHSQRKHAKISPSGLKNFETCPGYVREDDDSKTPHPVTLEGTKVHEALDDGDLTTLPEELRPLAEYCETYAGMLPTSAGEIIKEPKLDAISGVFGYADQVQIDGKDADVLDWKLGWMRVDDAAVNPQGFAYGLGVFNAYPSVDNVTVHFVQPRLGYVTCHTFTREDEPEMAHRIRSIVAAVANAKPEDYNPCPENCRFCMRADCPAVGELGHKVALDYQKKKEQRQAAEAKLRGEDPPKPISNELPTEFYPRYIDDPQEMAKALQLAPILESWAGSCLHRAKVMRVKEGIEIPGWELAHRKGRKSITNGGAAWAVVKDRVSPEDFAAASTPALTKLREAYTQTSEKGKKAADGRLLETRLQDVDALSDGGEEVPYLKKIKK